jgi:hypothetical protein
VDDDDDLDDDDSDYDGSGKKKKRGNRVGAKNGSFIVARIFLGKKHKIVLNAPKWILCNIPDYHKIYQNCSKKTNGNGAHQYFPSQDWQFWYEKIPFGNPSPIL